jgi:hypothetical protein
MSRRQDRNSPWPQQHTLSNAPSGSVTSIRANGEDDAHCELIRRGAGPVGRVKSACDKVSSRVDLVQA